MNEGSIVLQIGTDLGSIFVRLPKQRRLNRHNIIMTVIVLVNREHYLTHKHPWTCQGSIGMSVLNKGKKMFEFSPGKRFRWLKSGF